MKKIAILAAFSAMIIGCETSNPQKRAEAMATEYLDSLFKANELFKSYEILEFEPLDTVFCLSDTLPLSKKQTMLEAQYGKERILETMLGGYHGSKRTKEKLDDIKRQKQEIIDTYSASDIKYLTLRVKFKANHLLLGEYTDSGIIEFDPEVTKIME